MPLQRSLLLALSVATGLALATLPSCLGSSDAPADSGDVDSGGVDSGGVDSGLVVTTDAGVPSDDAVSPVDTGAGDATVPADAAEAGASDAGDAAPIDDGAGEPEAGDANTADAPGAAASITSFTVTPSVIPAGATRTVTLDWAVTGATSLSISGIGAVTGTSTTTSVSAATTFTLTATGATGVPATANASVTTAPSIYIDVLNGHDAAPGDGTAAHPYQTVSKAGGVATSGQTIYVAAGTYPLQTAAVKLADGVGVEALSYGTVTFAPTSGNSFGLTFMGSGFVHGVLMSSAWVNVAVGTVTLDGVQFANIADSGATGQSGINVSATGHVVVTPGGLTSYLGAAVSSFASVVGSGQLEIHGGALNDAGKNAFDGSALISASGTTQVLLDGVTVESAKTSAIGVGGTPHVTLQNGTLIHACAGTGGSAWSLNINSGSPTFIIDDSTISASPSTGIYVNGGATPNITLRNGAVVESSVALGIYFQGVTSATSTLVFDTARISGNGQAGIRLGSGAYDITMRGTQITNNTQDGLYASLVPGSVIDLGTATTAGGNTFTGNAAAAAASSNVNFTAALTSADLVIDAVGNAWDPTANGADGSGHFPAGTTFSAPPTVTGKNVQLQQSGTGTSHLKLIATP